MAAKAEVLTGKAITRTTRKAVPTLARRVARSVGPWVRRGQLGSSAYTDMGRYTGGRV